jgi:hypothetical protein
VGLLCGPRLAALLGHRALGWGGVETSMCTPWYKLAQRPCESERALNLHRPVPPIAKLGDKRCGTHKRLRKLSALT